MSPGRQYFVNTCGLACTAVTCSAYTRCCGRFRGTAAGGAALHADGAAVADDPHFAAVRHQARRSQMPQAGAVSQLPLTAIMRAARLHPYLLGQLYGPLCLFSKHARPFVDDRHPSTRAHDSSRESVPSSRAQLSSALSAHITSLLVRLVANARHRSEGGRRAADLEYEPDMRIAIGTIQREAKREADRCAANVPSLSPLPLCLQDHR